MCSAPVARNAEIERFLGLPTHRQKDSRIELSQEATDYLDRFQIAARSGSLAGIALRQAIEASRNDLRAVNLEGLDLSGIDLAGADCRSANFFGANCAGAGFQGARLDRANLWDTNLTGANLKKASARKARFSGAQLAGADLAFSDLSGADFEGANLENAIVFRTQFRAGRFPSQPVGELSHVRAGVSWFSFGARSSAANLSDSKGLNSVRGSKDSLWPGPLATKRTHNCDVPSLTVARFRNLIAILALIATISTVVSALR